MNSNSLYFRLLPADAANKRMIWSPAETFKFRDGIAEVVVLEAQESGNGEILEAHLVARYSWPVWRKLWCTIIARDYPAVNEENFRDYDLSAWDNDVIEAIAADLGEQITGNR